jgi:transposase
MHEKQQKSVAAVAFAFGVSKATMQRWLAEARSQRRALMQGGAAADRLT